MSPNSPVLIRTRRWMLVVAVLGALTLPVAAWVLSSRVNNNSVLIQRINDERARSDQAAVALCALRGDLERRVASGKAFQRDHPHGAFGFSAALIDKSIRDQQRTIRALRHLHCQ